MITYFGNKYWNDSTGNDKKIVASLPVKEFETVAQKLDAIGFNYYAYTLDNSDIVKLAIGKNYRDVYQRVDTSERLLEEPRFNRRNAVSIIGNTPYRNIQNKSFKKYDADFTQKLAEHLNIKGIDFSARIVQSGSEKSTITVDESDLSLLNQCVEELKLCRNALNSNSSTIYANANINSFERMVFETVDIDSKGFLNLQSNLEKQNIRFSSLIGESTSTIIYDGAQESEFRQVFNDFFESRKTSELLLLHSLNEAGLNAANETLEAISPAVRLFLEKNNDDYFIDSFVLAFSNTEKYSLSQLNRLAQMFAENHKDKEGAAHAFGGNNIFDLKKKFDNQIKLGELTDGKGFNDEQLKEIEKLVEADEVGDTVISFLDYTFTPAQIERLGHVLESSNPVEAIYKIFSEVKNVPVLNIRRQMSHGTYMPELPEDDFYYPNNELSVKKSDTEIIDELKELANSHRDKINNDQKEFDTIVINAFAGPGAGKTTSCLEITERLKKQGFVAEYVQEYAKELVWDNRTDLLDGSLQNQFDLFKEQLLRVDRLYGKVDFIVTDCPVILIAEYLKEKNEDFISATNEIYNHFDNFNYFVERDVTQFETEGRIHNLEQSLKIDSDLKETLNTLGLNYSTYNHSNIADVVNDLIKYKENYPEATISTRTESGEEETQISNNNNVLLADDIESTPEQKSEVVQPDTLELEIGSSENGLLRSFMAEHYPDNKIPFALGNALIEYLDKKQHIERDADIEGFFVGYYNKTKFIIRATINGKNYNYDGRYDIGDGEENGGGSIINHIESYLKGNEEEFAKTRDYLDVAIPFFKEHSQLTEEEQKVLDDFKADNKIILSKEDLSIEEKYFLDCDIAQRIAKQTLSWDEIESLGIIFFDDDYIQKFKPNEKAIYGVGLKEPETYKLAARYKNGEDISQEFTFGLLGETPEGSIETFDSKLNNDIKFSIYHNAESLNAVFGRTRREVPFTNIFNAYMNLFRNEYVDTQLDRDSFINAVDNALQNNQAIINAYNNSDQENYRLEVQSALNKILTNMTTGTVVIDGFTKSQTTMFLNRYYDSPDLQEQIFKRVLKDLNNAFEKAKTEPELPEERPDSDNRYENQMSYNKPRQIQNLFEIASQKEDRQENDASPIAIVKGEIIEIDELTPTQGKTVPEQEEKDDYISVTPVAKDEIINSTKITLDNINLPSTQNLEKAIENNVGNYHIIEGYLFPDENVVFGNYNAQVVSQLLGVELTNEPITEQMDIAICRVPFELLDKKALENKGYHLAVYDYDGSVGFTDMFSDKETSDTPALSADRHNYRITADSLSVGGAKTKFRNNIEAINLLHELNFENRFATPDEQEVLSKYSGWGGLAMAFNENNDTWANEFTELYTVLSPDEYEQARASTLSAFYTPSEIIDGIYQFLNNIGFTGGDILDPSAGVGNFFGRIPKNMMNSSRLFAVEKELVSGNIAKQLYPTVDITVDGYENTAFNKESFDAVISNIPFGDFGVIDSAYDKYNFKIHEYYFIKSLDLVHTGGVIAFVTSKGVLDRKSDSFRNMLAERADLLGAIRLPNNAFKSAGTEVTSDIIFLQKRSSAPEKLPEWVSLSQNKDGLTINQYFVSHPEMILGNIVKGNKLYGRDDDTMCVPFDDNRSLKELINASISKITGKFTSLDDKPEPVLKAEISLQPPENIRNESYFVQSGNLYFYGADDKSVSLTVTPVKELWINTSAKNPYKSFSSNNIRMVTAYVDLRDTLRELLEIQQRDGVSDSKIENLQNELSVKYDFFSENFGLLNSKANKALLERDNSYPLVASLEEEVKDGVLTKKSAIFTERTISPKMIAESVDSAIEALNVSVVERGCVDLPYMSHLCELPIDSILNELKGEIYPSPELSSDDNVVYLTASEYLSGDIYKKLEAAKEAAQKNTLFEENVSALTNAIPKPLSAGDIDVSIGASWIPIDIYRQFMYKVFQTPTANRELRASWYYSTKVIDIDYSPYTNKWIITNKTADSSQRVTTEFGTQDKNAYAIFENLLNLSETKIYRAAKDKNGNIIYDEKGDPKREVDPDKTKLAQQKGKIIQREFSKWIFAEPERRKMLVQKYNREFNCIKPRVFDGSRLNFPGMSNSVTLRPHQKDAIAHAIYGGNTLFAHSVGAGKTYEMIATAMECKRLAFCSKSLIVVPNHLTEQIGNDFLKLYPNANILVATKRDFQKSNRRQLIAKIATGNYDAVIIGHSQLKMIPVSPKYQINIYKEQINDIVEGIKEAKRQDGSNFQIKAMERTKKSLEKNIRALESKNQDDLVYFEELGIDKLFVDEAHEFKNLFCATKLNNVAGISSTASQRAMDLFIKCRYLDEKTDGKGVVFATGTPLSNSITELHTMMRYLEYDYLSAHNCAYFDNWISIFGKVSRDYEIDPTGTRFKERTRIAEFCNLPEVQTMFRQCADVKVSNELNLDVPECITEVVNCKPTELQQALMRELSERADDVNAGSIEPYIDNFLKITSDGRKLALDPRLVNPSFEDNPETKLNRCVENVLDIYYETSSDKLTQIIFCDLGVPKSSGADNSKNDDSLSVSEMDSLEEYGKFCVYDDIRQKLINAGVSKDEIAYIHHAKNEAQKAELFKKVRDGDVRVLLGSTSKMGTGTNIQDRLVAMHDLDVPWRPSDLEQRRGRMVRQGNMNKTVHLYRYVTEGTFDAYSYQVLEKKQQYIGQIMTCSSTVRKCSDVDQEAFNYAEIKALCAGDPRIREKLVLDNRVAELEMLNKSYLNNKYKLQDKISFLPQKIESEKSKLENIRCDIQSCDRIPRNDEGKYTFAATFGSEKYTKRTEAADALDSICKKIKSRANNAEHANSSYKIGQIYGFDIIVRVDSFGSIFASVCGKEKYTVSLNFVSALGSLTKIENVFKRIESVMHEQENKVAGLEADLETSLQLVDEPFEFEGELAEKQTRLEAVTEELNQKAKAVLENKVEKVRTNYFSIGKDKKTKSVGNNRGAVGKKAAVSNCKKKHDFDR